jgi:nitrous oxidase accessory protein
MKRWIAVVFCVIGYAILPVSAQSDIILYVPGDYDSIGEAVDAAPDDAIIEIGAGEYTESIVINRPVTLRGSGERTAFVFGTDDAPIIAIANTQGVVIEGLSLINGQYGIFVTRSQDVTLRHNTISASRLAGIKVRHASAYIEDNSITDTQSPYGQGIWVTNTTDYRPSFIIGNTISNNPLSGITTNMTSMVFIESNFVSENGQRGGIAITEMSHAVVQDNIVSDNAGNGIYVYDMSRAALCNNTVTNTIFPDITSGSRYGNGIAVDYHSTVDIAKNTIIGNVNHGISVLTGSLVELGVNNVDQNGGDDVMFTEVTQASLPPDTLALCR